MRRLHPSSSPADGPCPLNLPVTSSHPPVLPVEARHLSLQGHDDLDIENVGSHDIPSDALVSQKSAGKDELFVCQDGSQVAGWENVTYAVEALQFPAGALHAPSDSSQ